jgi:hypothetical protein
MIVSLIQGPTEVKLGRKTVLVDGRQVGYFHGLNKPLLFTRHMDEEEAEAIKADVEKLEGVTVGKCAIPAPMPPEWTEAEDGGDEYDEN